VHTTNSDSSFLFLSERHQFRFCGRLTTSNEFSGSVDSLVSEDHKLAGIDLANVVRLHVVGKEVLSLVVNVGSSDFVTRSSEPVHDDLETVLRGIRTINTYKIVLHGSRFS
jgi:hypothetical protein